MQLLHMVHCHLCHCNEPIWFVHSVQDCCWKWSVDLGTSPQSDLSSHTFQTCASSHDAMLFPRSWGNSLVLSLIPFQVQSWTQTHMWQPSQSKHIIPYSVIFWPSPALPQALLHIKECHFWLTVTVCESEQRRNNTALPLCTAGRTMKRGKVHNSLYALLLLVTFISYQQSEGGLVKG